MCGIVYSNVTFTKKSIKDGGYEDIMQIFLSYSWKQEEIANQLCSFFESLKSFGVEIVRDKDRLHYMQNIKDFMKTINKTDFAVLIISDEYLESENCMYEISELMRLAEYKDRILVLLSKKTKIFTYSDRLKYIKYWQEKYEELSKVINEAGLEDYNREEADKNLRKYNNIRNNISQFLETISELNLITFEWVFEYNMFVKMLEYLRIDSLVESDIYYVLAVTKSIAWGRNECIWWSQENKYTSRISNAKKFDRREIDNWLTGTALNTEYKVKKYVAIPTILIDEIGSEIIPFSDYYLDGIRRKKDMLVGNKEIFLSKEELKIYG